MYRELQQLLKFNYIAEEDEMKVAAILKKLTELCCKENGEL